MFDGKQSLPTKLSEATNKGQACGEFICKGNWGSNLSKVEGDAT